VVLFRLPQAAVPFPTGGIEEGAISGVKGPRDAQDVPDDGVDAAAPAEGGSIGTEQGDTKRVMVDGNHGMTLGESQRVAA
jgi:hypothetical protein